MSYTDNWYAKTASEPDFGVEAENDNIEFGVEDGQIDEQAQAEPTLPEGAFGGFEDIEPARKKSTGPRRTRKGKLNRLDLDFSLNWRDERKAFLDQYLGQPQFEQQPPTEDELDIMANYLLWGKDRQTGLNAKQEGLDIESKDNTWSRSAAEQSRLVSLEAMVEALPNAEQQMHPIGENHFRTKREVFSRQDALDNCPAHLRKNFEELFAAIDKLDVSIEKWELRHNKRSKEIRPQLLSKFSESELAAIDETIGHWNQAKYLKKRHELVELRREQYFLRDSFRQIMQYQPSTNLALTVIPDWEVGITVLPLGLCKCSDEPSQLLFQDFALLAPAAFTMRELDLVSKFYWSKMDFKPGRQEQWFDFRDEKHVYQLLLAHQDLDAQCGVPNLDSNLPKLMETLNFYVRQSDLNEVQREILNLKLQRKSNDDIRATVNKKYNKTYTVNYISTIFTQRIVPKICAAADYHTRIVGELFFPEEFKICTGCLETLLRTDDNFTKKKRSGDGFSSRCKRCEKKTRLGQSLEISDYAIRLDDIIKEKQNLE